MPQVRLGRFEAEEGELPPVCLRCGAPAAVFKRWTLTCYPDWSYLLLLVTIWPFLLASPLLRQRMRVLVPFCMAHRGYWLRRRLLFWVSLAVMAAVMIVILPILADGSLGAVWLLFWIVGIIWLAGIFVVRVDALYAMEMTDDSITLNGVSAIFVHQLRAEKEGLRGQLRRNGRGDPTLLPRSQKKEEANP